MKARNLSIAATFLALLDVVQGGLLSDAEVKAVLEERLEVKQSSDSRVFGIVVNADHEDPRGWHTNNVRDFCAAWKNRGLENENLFVFATEDVRPEISATNRFLVNGHPTKNNLIQLFGYLQQTSRPKSTYYVYLTGHGRQNGDEVFLAMDDLDLSGADLVRFLDGVKRRGTRFVVVADHCYSGGMIDQMKKSRLDFVCISSTDARHTVKCRAFTKPFWASFKREGVTLLEAFKTAQASLPSEDLKQLDLIPMYYSSGD